MTKKISSFRAFNDEESHDYLAQGYPKGRLFSNIYDKTKAIYDFVLCTGTWLKTVTGQLFTLAKNRDIDQADELLEEWETSVKIPEKYPRLDTVEQRRAAVKRKISKIPVYNLKNGVNIQTTIENYVTTMTGITVEIQRKTDAEAGTNSLPAAFPIVFGVPYQQRQLVLVVFVDVGGGAANNQFPLPFPVQFFDAQVPQATQDLLDIVLSDVVPTYSYWEYEILT